MTIRDRFADACEWESSLDQLLDFRPKTSEQVSQFVKLITSFTVSGEAAFAIRAAGNMPLPGCANIQDGVTLDLALIAEVELDRDKGLVRVSAGAKWGAVDEAVQAAGLGVCGGRSGHGGIGGLALAGMF